MSKPRLIYFDFAGSRGEECRIALHLAGIDFEDVRVKSGDWPAMKADMMSFRASFTPDDDTTFGLPAPAPLSVNLLAFALIHFFHASIILVSSALRSCSGFFIHSSTTALGAL